MSQVTNEQFIRTLQTKLKPARGRGAVDLIELT